MNTTNEANGLTKVHSNNIQVHMYIIWACIFQNSSDVELNCIFVNATIELPTLNTENRFLVSGAHYLNNLRLYLYIEYNRQK